MFRLFVVLLSLAPLVVCTAYAEKVALIGGGVPDPVDNLLVEHLEGLGLTVEPHADSEPQPVDLDGVDLVFISGTCESDNISDAYADSTVPVINNEAWSYDRMGFANDFSNSNGDAIVIVNADHPITQGFPAEVTVYDAPNRIQSADLLGDVDILAVRTDNPAHATIGVYEAGAKTFTGETLRARHITLFSHNESWTVINDDGWKLIENSALYGLGKSLAELQEAVEPTGKLAVRWADIKTQSAL